MKTKSDVTCTIVFFANRVETERTRENKWIMGELNIFFELFL